MGFQEKTLLLCGPWILGGKCIQSEQRKGKPLHTFILGILIILPTFLISGIRWWFHRSRHCLPIRPLSSFFPSSRLSARAMGDQFPTPIS